MAVKRGLNMARGLGALIPQGDGSKLKKQSESSIPAEAGEKEASSPEGQSSAAEGKMQEPEEKTESAVETTPGKAGREKKAASGSKAGTAKKAASGGKTGTAKKTASGSKAGTTKKAASGSKTGTAKKTASSEKSETAKKTSQAGKPASAAAADAEMSNGTVMLRISDVVPNKDQPRTRFEEDRLEELTESIRQFGVISPLLVQKKGEFYEIIAGERRWRAARMAGLKKVPAVIREYTNQEAVEISLIENIQREDLNAMEEAKAYQRLMDEFSITQEEVSRRVSKSRSAVANSLRLLSLDPKVQSMVVSGELSAGHARAILPLEGAMQAEAAKLIIRDALSVRDTEKYVKKLLKPAAPPRPKQVNEQLEAVYLDLEHQLSERIGTKVQIQRKRGNKGKIEIEYYSQDDLERIIGMIR